MTKRHYLKDAMPRLYMQTEAFLKKIERPDLLEQLPHLYITGRCSCGDCSDFSIDSDIPEMNRENGSQLLTRPLFYHTDWFFSIGLSGADGLTLGEHERSYIAAFEMNCGDYTDFYVHRCLNAIGFVVHRKLPKVRRYNYQHRRKRHTRVARKLSMLRRKSTFGRWRKFKRAKPWKF